MILRQARAGQVICIAALGFVAVVGLTHPTNHLPVIYERHARRRRRIAGNEAALKALETD